MSGGFEPRIEGTRNVNQDWNQGWEQKSLRSGIIFGLLPGPGLQDFQDLEQDQDQYRQQK